MTGHDADADRLRAALEGERENAAYWRRLAHQRAAGLDAIKRRKAVRAVLALDRRILPLRWGVAARRQQLDRAVAQAQLVICALPSRRHLAERRGSLLAALEGLPDPPAQPRALSIVVVADRPLAATPRIVCETRAELVVVLTRPEATAPPDVDRVICSPVNESVAAAAARGAAATSGELLCFLAATTEPLETGWLGRLGATITDEVVAATPMLVHPERALSHASPHDLRVRALGFDVIANKDGIPVVQSRETGSSATPGRAPVEVAAGSGACLLVDRHAHDAVGGLAPLDDLDAAAVDLCWRLRARGGRVVAVPGSVVVDHRPARSLPRLANPIDHRGTSWQAVIERQGPALLRWARGTPITEELSIALTVAAPSAKMAPKWGDWHLAQAFARSLRRRGHSVRVQTADRADDPVGRCCDVHVVVRGREQVRRTPGQHHVLWVISHPEGIEADECDEADLVLVASAQFAAQLHRRTSTPIEILLQATDHRRFRPLPPDPRHAHPVAVVAKTRDVLRPVVADALKAGLRPALYGTGWEHFVDPELVAADYVPNEALPRLYSSVGVLLADHWDTMRSSGFVSNRLFDALACGTPVICDDLPEVPQLFGDAVPTYRDADELRALVDAVLADPTAARRRAAGGREMVLASHTFDHRARALLEMLARHGLDRPPGAEGARACG